MTNEKNEPGNEQLRDNFPLDGVPVPRWGSATRYCPACEQQRVVPDARPHQSEEDKFYEWFGQREIKTPGYMAVEVFCRDAWFARAILAAQPQQAVAQRKKIERAIIGLRDGWATRSDADEALSLLAAAPPAPQQAEAPCGWIQVIDGEQTQNFARDDAELKQVKYVCSLMNKARAERAEYIPVYRRTDAAEVRKAALNAERYRYLTEEIGLRFSPKGSLALRNLDETNAAIDAAIEALKKGGA